MLLRRGHPAIFLIAGFSWFVLSSILGLAILIGVILGTTLPPWVRLVHVHAALVGGAVQMILGGFLALIPQSPAGSPAREGSHTLSFLAINIGTIGMLAGFWLHQSHIVNGAGLFVIAACLWVARVAWTRSRHCAPATPNLWYYAVAVLALFGGLALGETLPFTATQPAYGFLRLAHIHLGLLGFITMVIIGMMHSLLPAVLNLPLSSSPLARLVSMLVPLGVAVLIGGFMNSSVLIELAGGGILFAAGALYMTNVFQTWMASGHNGTAASDHLLIGAMFFLITVILGILVGLNNLSAPPTMPFGSLHLVAYTHMALVGFFVNTAMGLLSHYIPAALAAIRVSSQKKRAPYYERLTAIMDRGRAVQLGGLSLGTMGLGIVATLTWNVPLNSMAVHTAVWICFGLFVSSFLIFSAKLAMAVGHPPEDSARLPVP